LRGAIIRGVASLEGDNYKRVASLEGDNYKRGGLS
jgi:hypothetical protein